MAGHKIVTRDFVQGDSFVIKVSHLTIVDQSAATYQFILSSTVGGAAALDISYDVAAAIATESPATTIADNAALGIVYVPIDSGAIAPGEYFGSLSRTIAGDTLTLMQSGLHDVRKVVVHEAL